MKPNHFRAATSEDNMARCAHLAFQLVAQQDVLRDLDLQVVQFHAPGQASHLTHWGSAWKQKLPSTPAIQLSCPPGYSFHLHLLLQTSSCFTGSPQGPVSCFCHQTRPASRQKAKEQRAHPLAVRSITLHQGTDDLCSRKVSRILMSNKPTVICSKAQAENAFTHLTFWTSYLRLACLKRAQNTHISLQLGEDI